MHALRKMPNNHIFRERGDCSRKQWDFCCHLKLFTLTCALLSLLFLPFVWLPLPVELDVVVVATKNRSGTIVPADKQNGHGY